MTYELEQDLTGHIGTQKYLCTITWRNGTLLMDAKGIQVDIGVLMKGYRYSALFNQLPRNGKHCRQAIPNQVTNSHRPGGLQQWKGMQ